MGTSARPCSEENEDEDGGDDEDAGAGASDGGAVRAPLPDARFWRYEEAGVGPSKAKFSGVFEVGAYTRVHFSPQRKRFVWDRGCI